MPAKNWLLIWLGFNQIDRIHVIEVFVSGCKKIKRTSKKIVLIK